MATHAQQAIALIRDTVELLQEGPDAVLASPEDAGFFRQKHKPAPPVQIQTPVVVFTPPPSPPPAPVVIHTPLPAPVLTPPPPLPSAPAPKHLRSLLATLIPELTVLPDIPSDSLAKKIASRWKTHNQIAPITLLHYQELPEQKILLEQLVKALDVYFGPARLVSAETVEKENQWDAFLSVADLKVVIACDHTLWQLPNLRGMFREIPKQEKRMLKEKPLFLLPDLGLYLKDPMLKRSLWKALCLFLSSSIKT